MAKLRKMLGDIQSDICKDLMKLIETQSKQTLASWALSYAVEEYLPIYQKEYPEDRILSETAAVCRQYLGGEQKLAQIKPYLKEAAQIARELDDMPAAQAAARAVATAYASLGTKESKEVYEECAQKELEKVYAALRECAVEEEPNPVKIKWNC